jgi:dihydrofolate synthase/folylpolyglutamate synthase
MERQRTSYQEAVRYLFSLQKFGIKFGLSKTSNLMKAFGNPHKGQKYVHIGGTNGKGSVAAFVASVLQEAGFKVGLYSSPHLVRFTERFRINNKEISQDRAATLIEELRAAFASGAPPTFFEATRPRPWPWYILLRKILISPSWKWAWEDVLMPPM